MSEWKCGTWNAGYRIFKVIAMILKKIHIRIIMSCAILGAVVFWLTASENLDSQESIKIFDTQSVSATHTENDSNKNTFTTRASIEPKNITPSAAYVATQDEIYIRLFDASAEERLKVLDIILQSTASYYSSDKIITRLGEMLADDDARIAEITQIVLVNMQELRSADDMKQGLLTQDGSALSAYPETFEPVPRLGGMTDRELEKSSATTTTENQPGYASQIDDLDASVRGRAIAEAMMQRDENTVNVFYKAIQDVDARNRLLAVDGLQQILSTGMGDAQHIMTILNNAMSDPDPQVALMARQAVSGF